MLKEMFKKTTYISIGKEQTQEKPEVPKDLCIKCTHCGETLFREEVLNHQYICYKCGHYFRVPAKNRIRMIADRGSFEPWDKKIAGNDPLGFPGYPEKLDDVREKTRLEEAVITGKAKILGEEVVLGVCDSRFLMGSMGQAVGERITRAFERATVLRLPVVLFCCSGGARMQEGIMSLMQMAKTSAAVRMHSEAGLFYLPVLTDPTTGGVTASFAMLGDVILAEPGALIGFAGPRVIEQTIGQKLPEGFQRAEFLLEHGMIDGIVKREELKGRIYDLVLLHKQKKGYSNFHLDDRESLERKIKAGARKEKDQPGAWERMMRARMAERPTALDYIEEVFTDFIEMHGDRSFRDDGAVIGGTACLNGQPVTVIGIQKGRSTKENISRNFGMPSPEGYRKALRLMKQAEKFNRPVIAFVDTPGAACGLEAEERGQGEAIARNLMEMSGLQIPVLAVMIGEGGSGGALALAVGNEVWMLENATYSILSPEGFASILWKDSKRAEEASELMKITAPDLKELGIIERIIPEGGSVTTADVPRLAAYMKFHMIEFLEKYTKKTAKKIVQERYDRFRRF